MMLAWLNGLSWKIIGIVAAVLLVLGFIQVRSCQQSAQRAAENDLHKGQQGALLNSAADAVNTQAAANDRERASEDLTRSNEREIRNAKGSDAAVDRNATAAGLHALCARQAYRDTERCRVLRAPAR